MKPTQLQKLNELIAELGWDAYFITDTNSGAIKGAVIGTHDVIDQLTESNDPQTLTFTDEEKSDLEKIYHKLLLNVKGTYWIAEINNEVEYQVYETKEKLIDAAVIAVPPMKLDIFTKAVKINTLHPYSIYLSSGGTIFIFPTPEIAEEIHTKMAEKMIS